MKNSFMALSRAKKIMSVFVRAAKMVVLPFPRYLRERREMLNELSEARRSHQIGAEFLFAGITFAFPILTFGACLVTRTNPYVTGACVLGAHALQSWFFYGLPPEKTDEAKAIVARPNESEPVACGDQPEEKPAEIVLTKERNGVTLGLIQGGWKAPVDIRSFRPKEGCSGRRRTPHSHPVPGGGDAA